MGAGAIRWLAILLAVTALAALTGVWLATALGRPGTRAPDLGQSPVERFALGRDVQADAIAVDRAAAAAHAVNNRVRLDARMRTSAAHPGHRLLAPRDPARAADRKRIEAAMAEARSIDAMLSDQMAELDRLDRDTTARYFRQADAGAEPVRIWRGDAAPETETAPAGGDRDRRIERGIGGGESGRAPVIAGG